MQPIELLKILFFVRMALYTVILTGELFRESRNLVMDDSSVEIVQKLNNDLITSSF